MNAHMSGAAVIHQQLLFENLVSLQTEQKMTDCKMRKLQKENSEMKSALKLLKENFSEQGKKLESDVAKSSREVKGRKRSLAELLAAYVVRLKEIPK